MAKYRVTIEVEVDRNHKDPIRRQVQDAAEKAFNSLCDSGVIASTGNKWKTNKCDDNLRFKCSKIRQPKPQLLTTKECWDIMDKCDEWRSEINLLATEAPEDLDFNHFWEWFENTPKFTRRARHAESVLRQQCDTREKLMRFKTYFNISGFNSRELDYNLLVQAVSYRLAQAIVK